MRSDNPWSRRPLRALSAIGTLALAPFVMAGCEDELEPRAYLGPVEPPAYTAPPVHTPGVPTAQPAPTDGLVEPPPATVEPCENSGGLTLAATDASSLGLAGSIVVVSAGAARVVAFDPASTACPAEDTAAPLAFADIGAVRAIDARGPGLVAGATGISALSASGERTICALDGAKAVARAPDTDSGYAITGTRELYALDWSGGACVVTPVSLTSSLASVLGTLALGTSATSGPWIATAERDTTPGAAGGIIARARRFDANVGTFDELSPALGGQAGTVCGIDGLAVTDDGERVAVIDGTCNRVLVFRTSDGELLSGVSSRARAIAPVPGARAFVTVESVADKASFTRVDAP